MPRDHARVNLAIWSDPDFRALPPPAQHLYLFLWTAPDLTYCGAHDWRPGRMSGLSAGATPEYIRQVAACLQARHFIVVDEQTEEVLVRSWIRFDGLMKQPRMAISCITAYAAVSSEVLRGVVVDELLKLRERTPDLACWRDDRVGQVLSHPAVSAKDLPTPDDPFKGGFAPNFAPTFTPSLGQTQPEVSGSVCTPPTTATATTTELLKTTAPRKRGARIPDPFEITDELRDWATQHVPGLNLDEATEEFVDYWRGIPGTKGVKLDWPATWRNRMREIHKRRNLRVVNGQPQPDKPVIQQWMLR